VSHSFLAKTQIPNRAGSGFKLNVKNLTSLSINLGPLTSSPLAPIGVSIDGAEFFNYNASAGANAIPLNTPSKLSSTTVRINVQGHASNRIILDSLVLNSVRNV